MGKIEARFKELTPWLTDEERNKVYIKYMLYIVRYFSSRGTRVFTHDKTEFTSEEYMEFKKQIFPFGIIKHFDELDRFIGHANLIQVLKDYSAAYLNEKREERKIPLKRFCQHFADFKEPESDRIEEGDIFKTVDGSVFKAIGTPDYTVKTVLAKCLQPNNFRHYSGNSYCICIENVTKLPNGIPDTPEGFPVGAYITHIKEGEGGLYRITGELDELGCQTATRIVPRRYTGHNRKCGIMAEAYLSPDIFRVITPEEMNEKLIKFIEYLNHE